MNALYSGKHEHHSFLHRQQHTQIYNNQTQSVSQNSNRYERWSLKNQIPL